MTNAPAPPDDDLVRCFGGPDDPLMMRYHDQEWGVPLHDDSALFELLTLECFQAGLSWRTILHKRENFRRAFADFDVEAVAGYTEVDIKRLRADAGIVRNRLKIESTIGNALRFLEMQKEFGSFDRYIWRFTGHRTLRGPQRVTIEDLPASTAQSDTMSGDLRKRGFRFVGPTICYAFMQSAGMVDDHIAGCWRVTE